MSSSKTGPVNQAYVTKITAAISNNNPQEYLEMLPELHTMNNQTIHRCMFEISAAPDKTAFMILDNLLSEKSIQPWMKSELIELSLDKAMSNSEFALLCIRNSNKATLKAAVPVFANILISETDTHILFEVLKAVGDAGEKSCIDVVGDFIFYDNEELKNAAVEALEKIGGASALKRLAFAATTSKADDQISAAIDRLEKTLTIDDAALTEEVKQFAGKSDTLENLKDDSDMAQLFAMLNSTSPHDRHTAIDLLIETGVKAIPAVSANIDMDDPDSIINGLDILGNMNHEAALPSVLKILNRNHKDSNVRFAACEAIAKLPKTDSITSLVKCIEDPSEQVRIAAATAINKNLSEILLAGIQSKIETSGRRSNQNKIVSAIIDSFSDNTFKSLLISDAFVFMASEYLETVSETTLRFFVEILNKRGTKTLAKKIAEAASQKKGTPGISICIVDDSEIMLNYYIGFFHRMGHTTKTFSDPVKAVEAIQKRRPDLVVSDLNMLNMNGLQLTDKIREKFNSRKLPVVIITTQSDFVKEHEGMGSILPDGSISEEMHLNLVLNKPPDIQKLKPLCCLIGLFK